MNTNSTRTYMDLSNQPPRRFNDPHNENKFPNVDAVGGPPNAPGIFLNKFSSNLKIFLGQREEKKFQPQASSSSSVTRKGRQIPSSMGLTTRPSSSDSCNTIIQYLMTFNVVSNFS